MSKTNIDLYNEFYIKELFAKSVNENVKDPIVAESLMLQIKVKSKDNKLTVYLPRTANVESLAVNAGHNTVPLVNSNSRIGVVINPRSNIIKGHSSIYTDGSLGRFIGTLANETLMGYGVYIDIATNVDSIINMRREAFVQKLNLFCAEAGTVSLGYALETLDEIKVTIEPMRLSNQMVSVRDSILRFEVSESDALCAFLDSSNVEHTIKRGRVTIEYKLDCISDAVGLEALLDLMYINITLASLED